MKVKQPYIYLLLIVYINLLSCASIEYQKGGYGVTSFYEKEHYSLDFYFLYEPTESSEYNDNYLTEIQISNISNGYGNNNIEIISLESKVIIDEKVVKYQEIQSNLNSDVKWNSFKNETSLLNKNNIIKITNDSYTQIYKIFYVYDADKVTAEKATVTLQITMKQGEEEFVIDEVYHVKRTGD